MKMNHVITELKTFKSQMYLKNVEYHYLSFHRLGCMSSNLT